MTHADEPDGRTESRADDAGRGSRTSFVLEAAQIEFLDRLAATVRVNSGHRLTKRAVIETLVSVLPMAHIALEDVICEDDLKEMLRGERELGANPGALPRLGRLLLTDLTARR